MRITGFSLPGSEGATPLGVFFIRKRGKEKGFCFLREAPGGTDLGSVWRWGACGAPLPTAAPPWEGLLALRNGPASLAVTCCTCLQTACSGIRAALHYWGPAPILFGRHFATDPYERLVRVKCAPKVGNRLADGFQPRLSSLSIQ